MMFLELLFWHNVSYRRMSVRRLKYVGTLVHMPEGNGSGVLVAVVETIVVLLCLC